MDLVGKRTVTKYIYEGVESSYADVTYTMNLRRRTLYYWTNVILPYIFIGEFCFTIQIIIITQNNQSLMT